MNQRTFLGLTHNPFTPPREGFFTGADRNTHLEHLRHLSMWSRRVLVVTGSFGIGKSSLFRELSGSLETSTKAARLSGVVVSSEREVLVGLLQGFGIAADLDAQVDDLAQLVAHHANEQEELGRVCMVMADDAHLLDVQAVDRLVSLVASSSLRLLLFAEASLITNLNRASKKHDIEWFEIRLTGFPKADIREYLEWRFRQAHYRGLLPFTDEQLEKIVDRSAGNPSVVDSIANRMLADMESGEIRNQGKGFPVMHASLAVLLVVMVGLIYLLVQEDSPGPEELLAVDSAGQEAVEDAAEDAGEDAGEEAVSEAADETPEPTTPIWADEETVDSESPGDDSPPASEGLDTAGAAPVTETVVDVVESTPTPETGEVVEVTKIEGDLSIPPTVDADAGASDTALSASEPAEPEPAEPEPAEPEVAEAAASEPQPAGTELAVEEPASADDFHAAQWLLRQDPDAYTLQILTLSTRARAAGFINRQDDPSGFALYRMQRDGKLLYVITYGVFANRTEAQDAVQGFEGEMAGLNPWVRPLRLVQDTIRGTLQD